MIEPPTSRPRRPDVLAVFENLISYIYIYYTCISSSKSPTDVLGNVCGGGIVGLRSKTRSLSYATHDIVNSITGTNGNRMPAVYIAVYVQKGVTTGLTNDRPDPTERMAGQNERKT